MKRSATPLFVDLDHTLLRIDCLHEFLGLLLRQKPFKVFHLILVLFAGRKTLLKQWLSEQVVIDVETLPYRNSVLALIKQRRAAGSKVFLATAANEKIADSIAGHLDCFDGVLASNESVNLKGSRKLEEIKRVSTELGCNEFDYVGDSQADLPIFAETRCAFLVARSKRVARQAREECPKLEILEQDRHQLFYYVKLLRPYQWAKNLLLFLPLILGHKLNDIGLILNALIGFALFSLTASAIYILNDWADVSNDRKHPYKRNRPLACGAIPLVVAPAYFLVLALAAICTSHLFLDLPFTLTLITYLFVNLLYSFWLKTKAMLDVIALTLMYVLRVIAGGIATDIYITNWLLSFCLFFFLSLALAKRFSELDMAERLGHPLDYRVRGYQVSDIAILKAFGVASAVASVFVLSLYIQAAELHTIYTSPRYLWFLCPIVLYWQGRFWMITFRGELHDAPVSFVLKDRVSYALIGGLLLVFLAATFAADPIAPPSSDIEFDDCMKPSHKSAVPSATLPFPNE